MSHMLVQLRPPRPAFAADMTPSESALMAEHAAFWSALLDAGIAVIFGPVMDPDGVWGLAILRAETKTDARSIVERDPVLGSGVGFRYEIYPMPRTHLRAG